MFICLRPDPGRDQPPRLEVAFCMYPRMHLIFIYYCVIILTIRVTGTDLNKIAAKQRRVRFIARFCEWLWLLEALRRGRKDMEENEF